MQAVVRELARKVLGGIEDRRRTARRGAPIWMPGAQSCERASSLRFLTLGHRLVEVRLVMRVAEVDPNREGLFAPCRRDQVTMAPPAILLEGARALQAAYLERNPRPLLKGARARRAI